MNCFSFGFCILNTIESLVLKLCLLLDLSLARIRLCFSCVGMYLCVCVCVCVCIYIYVCVCVCVCVCVYLYLYFGPVSNTAFVFHDRAHNAALDNATGNSANAQYFTHYRSV